MSAPYIPNRNATAARMAGGPQGAAYGWRGATGGMANSQAPQAPIFNMGTGAYAQGKNPARKARFAPKRYEAETINATQYDTMRDRQHYQGQREVFANTALDSALADPRAQAQMFQDFYAQQTNAIAAPILRQFQQMLAGNAGMNNARFGGQGGSTETARGEFGVSDVFSRNLSEVIDSNAARGVDAGFAYTDRLADRANTAQAGMDNTTQLAGGFGQNAKKKSGGIGGFLGGVVGAGVGALAGNPGFGAAVGNKIFGR